MRSTQVTFSLAERATERQFVADYLTDAWDRFETHEAFDRAWFWRFGRTSRQGPLELEGTTTLDGGGVILVCNGDPSPEPVVESERPRWRELEAQGLLEGWETTQYRPEYENAREKMIERFGETGGDLLYRLRPLACRATLAHVAEFENDLPPVGEQTEENPTPVGDWVLLHLLFKQQGHDWYDEIDAYEKGIENRLRSIEAFLGAEAARAELETVIEELIGFREEFSSEDSNTAGQD